ncbi:MAG TPA: hypothetical protein P5081_08975 [Phycisphaerae bacterium]|nr:hypothetical protein [Phycisphaerae bacterium]HRW53008.1 hypothetical protein [Phycisphaerae bacterium]
MMMVEEINKSVKKNRNWAVLGAVVGAVAIVGYFGYQFAMTVEKPTIRDNKPKVIVSYICNSRGLRSLAKIEQRQFLEEWRDYLMKDDAAQSALTAHLKDLDLDQRKAFVNEMVNQFKEIILDDARQYQRLKSAERNAYVHKKADELEGQEKFIRQLGDIFGKDMGGQDAFRGLMLEITTPAEREIIMPYIEALQRVIEQHRKQRRNAEVAANP